jgi:hypothetical protein
MVSASELPVMFVGMVAPVDLCTMAFRQILRHSPHRYRSALNRYFAS